MSVGFQLVHVTLQGEGAVLHLYDGEQVIGREIDCDHRFLEKSISRKHAKLTVRDGHVYIEDLESRNGTTIDDRPITKGMLLPEHVVGFGTAKFRLCSIVPDSEEIEETFHISVSEIEQAKSHPALDRLTTRQREVCEELLTGATEEAIAARLNLAKTTVHNHAKNIYSALGVHSRVSLIKLFLESNSAVAVGSNS